MAKKQIKSKPKCGMVQNKKNLLKGLELSEGHITQACEYANLNRDTYYSYKKKDKKFAEAVEKLFEQIEYKEYEFVKKRLFDMLGEDIPPAVVAKVALEYLKTKGKKYGYGENIEITGSIDSNIVIKPFEKDKDKDK